jgi:RNA polymerase sigma factor (sigma-70 family)
VRRFASAILLSGLLLAPGSASPGAATWLRIGLSGAKCARGGPYAFWLHRGSRARLLLYFQDGGGCWSYETCRPGSGFFQDSLRSPTDPSLPESGILDFSDSRNPFRDYTAVYLPYCTGDVHWGNNLARYTEDGGRTLTIHHVGFDNDRRVLRWVYRRYPAPRRIFVTGCSAGSVGSAVFAPYVMRHYRHARTDQFNGPEELGLSRPAKEKLAPGPLQVMGARLDEIEGLYREKYMRYRNALATITGSYDSARDAVQHAFAQAVAERARFRGDGSLDAWVWKIALRRAVGLRCEFAEVELNGSFHPALVEPERDPALAAALRALPPRRRLAVFLRYFADLSYAEIADILGVSVGTVAASLAQAHDALRNGLTEGVKINGDH